MFGYQHATRTSIFVRFFHRLTYHCPLLKHFSTDPAIYPHFVLWPMLSSLEAPRIPKQSRFTRSDLHALVNKSPLNSQRNVFPSKSHQDLHLAVFPRGADVLTPSGTVHHRILKTDADISAPSGTVGPEDPTAPPRVSTRLRSGSLARMSLPPSPRPVGGRSPTVRAAPTIPVPAAPTAPPRRTLSTRTPSTTRHSVIDRVSPNSTSLSRSVSMASPRASVPETNKLDRTASVNGPRANPRSRDSLVLQRVRAFQMHGEQYGVFFYASSLNCLSAEEPIKEDDQISGFLPPPRSSHPPVRKVAS
jgi:hypothetical protein